MIKNLLFMFLVLSIMLPLSVSAEGYLIKNRYQPNSTYHIQCKTESNSDIDFAASEEMLTMLKENGAQFPVLSKTYMDISEIVETGMVKEDKSFPVKFEVTDLSQVTIVNGVKSEIADSNNLIGTIISGNVRENNSVTDVQVTGNKTAEKMKDMLAGLISSMTAKIQYPDTPISVNDSFTQEIPLQIPIPGVDPINIKIKTIYTLNKVESDLAYFDTRFELEMNQQSVEYKVDSHGGGKGTLIHNLKRNYFVEYNSEMEMHLAVIMDELTIVTNSVSKTIYSVK